MDIPGARMIFAAVDRVSGPLKAMAQRLTWFNDQTMASLKRVSASAMRIGAAAGAAAMAVAMPAIDQRRQTEDALGGLASMGVKDLDSLEKAARRFSNSWSKVTRVEFLEAAYDIKSGISSLSDEAVADMTRLAALTGVATKASGKQMTELFAQGYNIYGKLFGSAEGFGQAFSAGLAEAVARFRTDGGQMAGAIANVQGIPTGMGVGMAEQLAVLGMLRNTYKSGEEAGTSYKGVMLKLIEAGDKLGTSFTDQNGKALSMVQIIGKLEHAQKKAMEQGRGAKFQQAMKEAFGEDGMKMISALMGKSDELKAHIEGVTAAVQKGEKHTQAMARAMDSGLGAAMGRVGNLIGNVADIIGKAMSPAIQAVAERLAPLVERFQQWAEEHPGLIRLIGVIAGVLGVMAAALGVATMAMWAFNAAAALNPLVWVAAAVAGAVATVVAIYVYWEQIWEAFTDVIRRVTVWILELLGGLVDGITNAWNGAMNFLSNTTTAVGDWLSQKWAAVTGWLGGVWDGVAESWANNPLVQAAGYIIDSVLGTLQAGWERVTAWFGGAWAKLKGVIPDVALHAMGLTTNEEDAVAERQKMKAASSFAQQFPQRPAAKEFMTAGQSLPSTPAAGAGQAAPTKLPIPPEQLVRQANDVRVRTENQTRIELELKNAPGLGVRRVEKRGDDADIIVAGPNFAPGF